MTKSVLVNNEKYQHQTGYNEFKSENSTLEIKCYHCTNGCGRTYKLLSSLTRHLNLVKKDDLNFHFITLLEILATSLKYSTKFLRGSNFFENSFLLVIFFIRYSLNLVKISITV